MNSGPFVMKHFVRYFFPTTDLHNGLFLEQSWNKTPHLVLSRIFTGCSDIIEILLTVTSDNIHSLTHTGSDT